MTVFVLLHQCDMLHRRGEASLSLLVTVVSEMKDYDRFELPPMVINPLFAPGYSRSVFLSWGTQ